MKRQFNQRLKRRRFGTRSIKKQGLKSPAARQTIYILDFGSQYTQLIARRVRENKVFSKIIPFNTPANEIAALNPKGLILSGVLCIGNRKKEPLPR